MGRVTGGEFTTAKGCRVRVRPIDMREDDADGLLSLEMTATHDDRRVDVLLTSAERVALRRILEEG